MIQVLATLLAIALAVAAPPAQAQTEAKVKNVTGVVKSATASGIVITGREKRDWAFAVDGSTTINKDGKAVTPTDLKVGEPVAVTYTEQDGKVIAQTITVGGVVDSRTSPSALPAPMKK